jgi:hypothetical protein
MRKATYPPNLAAYVRPAEADHSDFTWQALPESVRFVDVEALDRELMGLPSTWACRCGTGRLEPSTVVENAWQWSAARARSGKPPRPRVVRLGPMPT